MLYEVGERAMAFVVAVEIAEMFGLIATSTFEGNLLKTEIRLTELGLREARSAGIPEGQLGTPGTVSLVLEVAMQEAARAEPRFNEAQRVLGAARDARLEAMARAGRAYFPGVTFDNLV